MTNTIDNQILSWPPVDLIQDGQAELRPALVYEGLANELEGFAVLTVAAIRGYLPNIITKADPRAT